MPTKIPTLTDLKDRCEDGSCEAFIVLNGGARSSKTFQHFPEGWEADSDEEYVEDGQTMRIEWEVYNEIDSSFEGFETDEDMLNQTHVGAALHRGALFAYG